MSRNVHMEALLKDLDEAYSQNNLAKINEINSELMRAIGVEVSEATVDFEFVNSIRGKPVYNNLTKILENKEISDHSIAKTVTSLITHMIIESEVKGVDIEIFPIRSFLGIVEKLLYDKNYDRGDLVAFLSDKYGKFI